MYLNTLNLVYYSSNVSNNREIIAVALRSYPLYIDYIMTHAMKQSPGITKGLKLTLFRRLYTIDNSYLRAHHMVSGSL